MTPKEEPKQECPHPEPRKDYYRDGCFKCWQCGKIVVEHNNYKQETLEEAAENKYGLSDQYWKDRIGFVHGAKWQAERMLKFILDEDNHTEGELGNSCIDVQTLVYFIEQFKKKQYENN